jgi:uncharacterized protein YggE
MEGALTLYAGLPSEGLTVIGEATRSIAPDVAELTVGVQTTSTSAAQALREHATRMLHVVQAILALGVSQTDIETTGLSFSPLYPLSYPQPGPAQWPAFNSYWQPGQAAVASEVQPLVGYRVSSTAKVSLRDTNRSGEVLDTAVGAGANFHVGIAFRLRDDTVVRRALLEAAGRAARSKAEAIAVGIGKQLGEPFRVTEETACRTAQGAEWRDNGPMPPPGGLESFFDGAQRYALPGMPSELTMHTRVQVTYRLC